MVQVVERVVKVPRFFNPRSYQREFFHAMRGGTRRAALVWHRRAGKDLAALNWVIESMLRRVGTYYTFFPTYSQGKKILWDGMQADGRRFRDHFPPELVRDTNETEMKVVFANGSIWQIIGADNSDSIIGTNPIGCVFSEYAVMNPRCWDLVRPILAENGGWAVFAYTPRGRNWGWKLWQGAIADHWFTSLKTIEDTRRDAPGEERFGEPVVPMEAVEAERRSGMPEELIRQEFWCSWEGALVGSYFGDQIEQMRKEGRVTSVPWDPETPVDTSWDLGVDNETVIGFWQELTDPRSNRVRVNLIDVLAGSRGGVEEYWRQMKHLPYTYGRHYGPHDLRVTEWGTGATRLQTAWRLGLSFEVQPKLSHADYHQAIRRMLPYVWVDEERCGRWIEAMSAYRREYDERLDTFRDKPLHDWSSNWADMTKYRATAFHPPGPWSPRFREPKRPEKQPEYTVFENPYWRELDTFAGWRRSQNPFAV
jgi:hypothetical protein